MKIDINKLNLVLARQCKSIADLRTGTSPQTLQRIRHGGEVQPRTAGRIARALNVDVAEILEMEVIK